MAIRIVGLLSLLAIPALTQDVGSAVREAYRLAFRETIPAPAIFNDQRSVDCSQNGHLTTTAYLPASGNRSTLLQMYMSRDGMQVTRRTRSEVIKPAGTFRVLVVIGAYTDTVNADGIALFEAAQQQINEDHAAFARSRYYPAPLIAFQNTNVVLAPNEIGDPHRPADVRAAAARRGLSPKTFDFVIMIDPDPAHTAGGLATPPNDVYVGNFSNWTTILGSREWGSIARTAYHHEVAHRWGWDHGWSPTCGGAKLGFRAVPGGAGAVWLGGR